MGGRSSHRSGRRAGGGELRAETAKLGPLACCFEATSERRPQVNRSTPWEVSPKADTVQAILGRLVMIGPVFKS